MDYLVRLEQGRATRSSAQVATSLARGLQLSDTERDHLFVVAELLPPSPTEVPSHLPPGLQRLVARMEESPLAGTDLRVVVYTAAAGLNSAQKLDFFRVSAVRAMRSPAS